VSARLPRCARCVLHVVTWRAVPPSSLRRAKISSMRASVDNKPPQRFKHMKRNLKKEQMEEGSSVCRCRSSSAYACA
jgi:hypothetical protein